MKHKPHIIADRDIPFLRGILEPYATTEYIAGSDISHGDALRADALIVRTRTRCDGALLEGTPVSLIATATIGHDHIDAEWCERHRIEVTTAEGCNARGVLQYVMAALYALGRLDEWTPPQKTLGVVGVGNVGSLIAEYGRLFGFRVLCCDPLRREADPAFESLDLPQMLPQCDIVTCHVPLSRDGRHPTLGLAGRDFFAAIKPGSVFINTSRGKVVSDRALTDAIQRGQVGRAVIDTWNDEPRIDPLLLRLTTFATSHIAGYTLQGKAAGTAAVVRAASRHFGFPLGSWYPPEVTPSHADPSIGWERMGEAMPRYFDIAAETGRLKTRPETFEETRNNYDYRTEFF